MGTIFAAAPFEDFARENSPLLAVVFLGVLGILVVRLVVKNTTRLVLLGLIVMAGVFLAVERENITQCTQTCRCELAGFDTSIAYCDPKFGPGLETVG